MKIKKNGFQMLYLLGALTTGMGLGAFASIFQPLHWKESFLIILFGILIILSTSVDRRADNIPYTNVKEVEK